MPPSMSALSILLLGCALRCEAVPQQQQAPAAAAPRFAAGTVATKGSGKRSHIAMFLTSGCSRSTITFTLTQELLKLHGWRVWVPHPELLRKATEAYLGKKVRFCHETGRGVGADVVHTWNHSNWVARLQQAHAVLSGDLTCSGKGEHYDSPTIFLVKGKDWDKALGRDFVHWATPDSTSITILLRPNKLDTLICMLKDCFNQQGDSLSEAGHPVDAGGKRRNECYGRRKMAIPDEEYKVYINASWLQRHLQVMQHWAPDQGLASQLLPKYGEIPVVTTADLFAFEYSWEPGELRRSVGAWMEQLRGLGAPPEQDIISAHLQQLQQKGLHHEHSYSTEIYNWEEVKRVVMGAGKQISWMWHD